jgi:hypothetical protein
MNTSAVAEPWGVDVRSVSGTSYNGAVVAFTAPWPGPGNSEGPVDPDGWTVAPLPADPGPESQDEVEETVAITSWPGPGDSEG